MKNFIIMTLSIMLIGFMSANLQIQTNIENAVQTIKKVFITSDGLTSNGENTLVTINSGNDGKVFIKNTLETSGAVVLNGIPVYNNPVNYKILTIGENNTVYKTDPNIFSGGGENQRLETTNTLSTNKKVSINNAGGQDLHQFWVGGTSIFQSGSNYIYIYPKNQFSSLNAGLASRDNNLKINTKSGGNLFINYDVNANTIIRGKTSFNTRTGVEIDPTATIDISSENGYNQLRLRQQYAPTSTDTPTGSVGDFARGTDGVKYYIYVKTPAGRQRTALETFNNTPMP